MDICKPDEELYPADWLVLSKPPSPFYTTKMIKNDHQVQLKTDAILCILYYISLRHRLRTPLYFVAKKAPYKPPELRRTGVLNMVVSRPGVN